MDFETIKSWLAEWTEKPIKICRIKGILGFALGPIALLLVNVLARLFTHDREYKPGEFTTALWNTLAVLPCLFVGNRLAPRRNLMEEVTHECMA